MGATPLSVKVWLAVGSASSEELEHASGYANPLDALQAAQARKPGTSAAAIVSARPDDEATEIALDALAAAEPGEFLGDSMFWELIRSHHEAYEGIVERGTYELGAQRQRFRLFCVGPQLRSAPVDAPSSFFIGRESELADVRRLLELSRMVSIVGVPGVGKSAFLARLTASLDEEFAQSYWIDLSQVSAEESLIPSVARLMGVRKPVEQTTEDALLHFLGDRSVLLAFDGIELHREALASLLRTFLTSCPNVAVLTASLFPVATGIDVRYRLGGLATPIEATEESDAVAVFVDRAQEVEPNFRLNDRTLRAVADLAERLDGNARAIQIAARKANLLSPQQMINRLDRPLDFLQSTLPGRNASMRQSLAWGFGLLRDRAQSLLGSLGVFRGSFTVDDAEALGDDLDAFGELVDGGFLVPVHGRFAQRFVIAPFYRWFLRERDTSISVAVEEAWARRIEDAVRTAPNLETEAAKEVIRALQDDIAAFVRGRASRREDAPRALACVVNAANYWLIGDGAELGYELATLVVMAPGSAQSPAFPRGLIAASAFAYQAGHPTEARRYARHALRETSDPTMRAKAWVNYGTAVSAVGRNRSALRAMEYAARNATLAKDERLVWHARTNIMALAARIHRDDLALVAARELEALGSQDFILRPYFEMNYADLLIRTGHYGDAERRLRTALDWFQSLENAVECARCLRTIGQLRLAEGDTEAACIAYTEAMNYQAQGAISETEQVKMTADLHRIREQLGESRYLELRLQANAFDYNSLR